MAEKYVKITSGQLTEQEGLEISAGAGDAGKIPALDSGGKLDSTLMPTGIGAETLSIEASETLVAGDFINIWDDSSVAKVRKADATTSGKPAHGFVLVGVTAAQQAAVYTTGHNDQLSAMIGGTPMFLSEATPGAATSTPPSTAGNLVQYIGVAASTSLLPFEPTHGVVLA